MKRKILLYNLNINYLIFNVPAGSNKIKMVTFSWFFILGEEGTSMI